MAKVRKRIDRASGQMSLFDLLTKAQQEPESELSREGVANVQDRLRLALCAAIKQSPLSRWEIAGQMSHLLGHEISKYSLDAWTAESKDGHRLPAEYLPAFCQVTGDRTPITILAEVGGMFAMPGPQALRAEIQKYDEQERKARAEKRKRMRFLEEMEE